MWQWVLVDPGEGGRGARLLLGLSSLVQGLRRSVKQRAEQEHLHDGPRPSTVRAAAPAAGVSLGLGQRVHPSEQALRPVADTTTASNLSEDNVTCRRMRIKLWGSPVAVCHRVCLQAEEEGVAAGGRVLRRV